MSMNAAPEIAFSSEQGKANYAAARRQYPAQAIVDLKTMRDNMAHLVSVVGGPASGTAVMGVVKADAYGHGLLPAALAALAGGATWLGTAQSHEALLLRKLGIGPDRCHILTWVYNGTEVPFDELIAADIDVSVGSLPGIDAAVMGGSATRDEEDGDGSTRSGHLVIRKPWPGMMQGVYNDEEKYQSYFSRFGCYESGDGAEVDEDGYFWILGRVDDSINVSGHRLSTAEIEAVLASCPEVAEAAVVPMPHALKGEGIYAYVVTRDEVPWSDDVRKKLRDTVRRDIGALASPEYIQFVEAMPKTCSGKVIRRMLRKIAGNVYDDLGDTTALAKPEVLDHIIVGHRNLLQGQHETANLPDEDQPKE